VATAETAEQAPAMVVLAAIPTAAKPTVERIAPALRHLVQSMVAIRRSTSQAIRTLAAQVSVAVAPVAIPKPEMLMAATLPVARPHLALPQAARRMAAATSAATAALVTAATVPVAPETVETAESPPVATRMLATAEMAETLVPVAIRHQAMRPAEPEATPMPKRP